MHPWLYIDISNPIMLKRFISSFLICLATFTFLTYRADCAIFKVIVYLNGQETAQASGIWVTEDVLLTSSIILEWGDQFFIEDPDTGTRYLAEVIYNANSMAFLSVRGLSVSAITTLSAETPQQNSKVYFPLLDGTRRDGLLSFENTPSSRFDYRYRFTMEIDSSVIGAPLMNRCEQLISVVSAKSDSINGLTGVSESYEALLSSLRASNLAFNISPAPCPTIEDQLSEAQSLSTTLQGDLDSLRNELRSLEDSSAANLNQSEEAISNLTAQKSALEQRITDTLAKQDSVLKQSEDLQLERDSLIENTKAAQAEIDSLISNTAEAQQRIDSLSNVTASTRDSLTVQDAENRRRLLLLIGISSILILIAAILLFLFWKRRRNAEEELLDKDDELRKAEEVIERKTASFSDVVLHGSGLDGNEIRVKVRGEILAQNTEGVILGRSSDTDCVIVEDSVSRLHARMTLVNNTVMIEDLNSLNGTTVDGIKLTPREKHSLSQGSEIVLGDVKLVMVILQ